jgi:septum formation protein
VCTKRKPYDFKLASGSPRRDELLGIAGWHPFLNPVTIEEKPHLNEDPLSFAKRLALEKAERSAEPDGMIVLGADTIVILDDRILGKPQDDRHAEVMLEALCGKVHQVITAIAIVDPGHERFLVDMCITDVPMREFDSNEIKSYIATGSPLDKAGAYGIQDVEFHPVNLDKLNGCFANVMGLPLCHLERSMKRLGIMTPENISIKCMDHTKYNCRVYKRILQREI